MPSDANLTRQEILKANCQKVLETRFDPEKSKAEVQSLLQTMAAFPNDRLRSLLDATLTSLDENYAGIENQPATLDAADAIRPYAHKMRGAVTFKSERFDAALSLLDVRPDDMTREQYTQVRTAFEEEYQLVRSEIVSFRDSL